MRKLILISLAILLLGLALARPVSAGDSPSIESCDSAGNTKDTFNPGESVYVKGSGLKKDITYYVYIVEDHDPWEVDETTIEALFVVEGPVEITTDSYGKIPPTEIWDSAEPGYYDIWADWEEYELYDAYDRIDDIDVGTAGFFVIPETPLGTIAVLLACFTATSLKRRKLY